MRSLRRRSGDEENPAWPGLVDVFAFGMVAMILLGALAYHEYRKEIEAALQRNPLLETTKRILGGVAEDLKTTMQEKPWPSIRVDSFNGKEIFFAKDKYTIDNEEDFANIRQYAVQLRQVLTAQDKVEIVINGTADPRILNNLVAPRNNVDLSALRAATVASILRDAGIDAERIFVQGLGEKGDLRNLSPAASQEEIDKQLEEFRKVYLELRVDLSKVKLEVNIGH